jgi:hypothetical protein
MSPSVAWLGDQVLCKMAKIRAKRDIWHTPKLECRIAVNLRHHIRMYCGLQPLLLQLIIKKTCFYLAAG